MDTSMNQRRLSGTDNRVDGPSTSYLPVYLLQDLLKRTHNIYTSIRVSEVYLLCTLEQLDRLDAVVDKKEGG